MATVNDGKSIKVKIFGSEYPLRMISTIHDKIPEQPPLTVAVLSALNITEDLFKEREKYRVLSSQIEDQSIKIGEYLDQCLNSEL